MAIPIGWCEVWFGFQIVGDSEVMYTHIGYEVTGTVTQAAFDAGITEWNLQAKPRWNTAMVLQPGHLLVQLSSGIFRIDGSTTTVPGTGASTPLPNNCAVLIKKTSILGGRRNRGRMYIPSPTEAEVDAPGLVTSGAITSWNTLVARLLPGGSVHTAFGFVGQATIFHDSGSQTPTNITSLTCQTKIGTQRRRMR